MLKDKEVRKRLMCYIAVALLCFGFGIFQIHKTFDEQLTSVNHATLDAALKEYYG